MANLQSQNNWLKYSGMQKFGNPLQNLWKCENV